MIDTPAPFTGPIFRNGHLRCNTCDCPLTQGIHNIDDACACRCHEAPRLYRRLAREPMCPPSKSLEEQGSSEQQS
jgi:hypothetical protein